VVADVTKLAEAQVTRLGGVSRVLRVRMAHPPVETPKMVVQWLRAVPKTMELWWRLAPHIDLSTIGMEFDDASPAEIKLGKSLKPREYAEETATGVLATKAAVSLDDLPRGTRNRILFYFDREVGDLTRIFKI
jgi:hypothetical protein